MKKKTLLLIIVIILLVAGGAFYYFNYYKKSDVAKVDEFLAKSGQDFIFSGIIKKVYSGRTLSVEINSAGGFSDNVSQNYQGKTYNFIATNDIKIYQISYPKGFEAGNSSVSSSSREELIGFDNLKVGDEINLYVSSAELSKGDSFKPSKIILRAFSKVI